MVRIALLAPLVSPLAPPFLGGAQALLHDLAAGLAGRGHDVALYAADGSHVPGVRVIPTGIDAEQLAAGRVRPTHPDADLQSTDIPADAELEDTPLARAFARVYDVIAAHASEHDLLHAHAYDWAAFAYAARAPLPVTHTLHLPNLDPAIAAVLARSSPPGPLSLRGEGVRQEEGSPLRGEGEWKGERKPQVHVVAVSQACAASYAGACRIAAVLYNGIDIERIPFGGRAATPAYLLFAGRISPEKGVTDAISIAARAGRHLVIAGGVYDRAYYTEEIAPRLERSGGRVSYVGELSRERLWELMAGAEALLCPIQWDEPFGLAACEAQATGTPVIAYARGGLREVVDDGQTGWLAPLGDIEAAAAAVTRVAALDRRACRAWVEQRFSLAAMLDAHERFYRMVLAAR